MWSHRNTSAGSFEELTPETWTVAWAPLTAHESEPDATASTASHAASETPDGDADVSTPDKNTPRRANATLLMLARNSELEKAAQSVRELEDKFNARFNYPWIFLNEVEFSDEFKG